MKQQLKAMVQQARRPPLAALRATAADLTRATRATQWPALRADPRGTLEDIVLRVTPAKAAGFINHLWGR